MAKSQKRVSDRFIALGERNYRNYFFGTAISNSGSVWTRVNITDNLNVSCLAFDPNNTNVFYLATSYTFEPKDGVLSQLKGSGSLRYFKSAYLQKLFGEMSVYINNVRDRNDQEYQYFSSPVKPFILKHYDFNWMNELRKIDETAYNIDLIARYRAGNTIIKADILNLPSFDKGEVINMILFYKAMLAGTRTLSMKDYITTNQKLLQELRKEYHLK